MTTATDTTFGETLKGRRMRRGLSQLDLGLAADVSSRHISFLETGRARPSREMVLRLSGGLDLPLRKRNELLLSAGFAPRYGARSLDDAELAEARQALQFILDAHEPYPAFVLDRFWQIVLWNRPQGLLLADLHGKGGSPADLNALDMVFAPGPTRDSCLNWEELASAVLRRLRRQVTQAGPGDPIRETWGRILGFPGVAELNHAEEPGRSPPIIVPMLIREGDQVFTWFSTLAVFGATGDVTLEELVIECFFPGDDATRAFVKDAASRSPIKKRPSNPPLKRG